MYLWTYFPEIRKTIVGSMGDVRQVIRDLISTYCLGLNVFFIYHGV